MLNCKRKLYGSPPLGLNWRSSYWFTTITVMLGISVDLLVYTIIIPVMPFHLERLGYHHASTQTGWLLFAYSAGLVLSTIPVAIFSEHYRNRKIPLIIGLSLLSGSQILLMEAPNYAVMCVARVFQGISSAIVFTIGLALLCDVTPSALIGRQLGIAMAGMSIGSLIGPPVGGTVYSRFGFRGPFIFSIIWTVVDLIARLLIIERKEAIRWGLDPQNRNALPAGTTNSDDGQTPTVAIKNRGQTGHEQLDQFALGVPPCIPDDQSIRQTSSLAVIFLRLTRSSRAVVAFIMTFAYGVLYTIQEPTLPLHLQHIWGLTSAQVGLVFFASVIPTLLSAPLSGWLSDKKGPEWVALTCLLLALPWSLVMTIEQSLALFIVAYALETFFISGVISPITAELAHVSREIEGVGFAHIYGFLNMAYGVGSVVGPLMGGHIYDNAKHGWLAVCLVTASLFVLCIVLCAFYTGSESLVKQARRQLFPKVIVL